VNSEGPLAHLREHPEVIAADLRLIAHYSPQAKHILDVGAGRGTFVKEAERHGFGACGLDSQPESPIVWMRGQVPGVLGDGAAAPFTNSCFDVVRMKEVIEHVANPLNLVREAHRLLRSGGLLIVHVPTPYSQFYPIGNFWDDYTHVRPFSRFALRRLIEDAGMEVVHIQGYMAGRNPAERLLGRIIARVFPHIYLAIARARSS